MKDIAQDLGVSIVTVSKALRNHPDIAAETKQRVLDRVKALHYRPNLMARSLVTGQSELVGLVVPDIVHPFFGEIAKAVSEALRQRGLFLVVSPSDGDPELEVAQIEHLLAYRLDALIVASCQPDATSLARVAKQGTPLILFDRSFPGFEAHFIGSDDYRIGSIAATHLIQAGRTRLAHIRGSDNSVAEERLRGFVATMRRHKLPIPQGYISPKLPDASNRRNGSIAMTELLALSPRPDAVFCFNDAVALGALETALASGLRVPEELAIIGCGNYHYDDALKVTLSSIDQSSATMGHKLAQLVLDVIDSKGTLKPTRIVLKPRLIVRDSTA
jgi:LacI family transcriptional regulator